VGSGEVMDPSVLAEIAKVLELATIGDQRRYVAAFERDFAKYLGAGHALGVNSGTSALYIALKALGIGPGDEVVTVANTWVSTITAILETGASCRFCDIDLRTGLMDARALKEVIGPATRALVPVHMYGNPVDLDGLMTIAKRHRLWVVEDACQGIGASFRGRPVGTWGDIGCFSFHTNKLVGAPADGGMIVTNDGALAEGALRLREADWAQGLDRLQHRIPSRLPVIAIPVLRNRLHALGKNVALRRRQFQHYRTGLADLPDTWMIEAPQEGEPSCRSCVLVAAASDVYRSALERAGWAVGPMYRQSSALLDDLTERGVQLPNTARFLRHHLVLPNGPKVADKQLRAIIRLLRKTVGLGASCAQSVAGPLGRGQRAGEEGRSYDLPAN